MASIINYKSSDRTLGEPVFTVSNDIVQQFQLGRIATGSDPTYGEAYFMYVKFTGATAIAAGDLVEVNRYAKTATQSNGGTPGVGKTTFYGVAMSAQALNVATPTYGWVMVKGVHDGVNMITGGTVGNAISGSATAGRGTSALANYVLTGTVLRNAGTGTGTLDAVVEMDYPLCTG